MTFSIDPDTIRQFLFGGLLAAIGLGVMLAFVRGFEHLDQANRDHPILLKGTVLFIVFPLWLLFDGTWIAGVFGVSSLAMTVGLISDVRRRHRLTHE